MTPVGSRAGTSLCETCGNVREVRTSRSRFLLCEWSLTHDDYPKYPPQPVVRCSGYQPKDTETSHEPGDRSGTPGGVDTAG